MKKFKSKRIYTDIVSAKQNVYFGVQSVKMTLDIKFPYDFPAPELTSCQFSVYIFSEQSVYFA